MAKSHIPLNLTNYEIADNPHVTPQQVDTALRALLTWLQSNQTEFYSSEQKLNALTETLKETPPHGSLNSFGRSIGLNPPAPATIMHTTRRRCSAQQP